MADRESFESLEQHLDMLIETSRQLGIQASDFQANAQSALNQKFTSMVMCMRDIDLLKENFKNVQVPASVFKYVSCFVNAL